MDHLEELRKEVLQKAYGLNWFEDEVLKKLEKMEVREENIDKGPRGYDPKNVEERLSLIKVLRKPDISLYPDERHWFDIIPLYSMTHEMIGHHYYAQAGMSYMKSVNSKAGEIIAQISNMRESDKMKYLLELAEKNDVIGKIILNLFDVATGGIRSNVSEGNIIVTAKVKIFNAIVNHEESRASFLTYVFASAIHEEKWDNVRDFQLWRLAEKIADFSPFFDIWYRTSDKRETVRKLGNLDYISLGTKRNKGSSALYG